MWKLYHQTLPSPETDRIVDQLSALGYYFFLGSQYTEGLIACFLSI